MISIVHEDHIRVFSDEPKMDKRFFYYFPSMEVLSDQDLILCVRQTLSSTDSVGHIRMKRSNDGGRTWQEKTPPTIHDEHDHPNWGYLMCHVTAMGPDELIAVYMTIDSNPHKPLFDQTTDGMQTTNVRVVKSYDQGATWEKPFDLQVDYEDLLVVGKAIVHRDKTISIPFETHNRYEQSYKQPVSAGLIRSYDKGRTFSSIRWIARNPDMLFGDARPVFEEQAFWLYFWAFDMKKGCDAPVHRSCSLDHGENFSPVCPIDLHAQITAPLYWDPGCLLFFYQDRHGSEPGIKIAVSEDKGATIGYEAGFLFQANQKKTSNNPFQAFSAYQFGYTGVHRLSSDRCVVSYWHEYHQKTACSLAIMRVIS